MELIKYATIMGQKYKINTDFRVAMECDRIINAPESEIDNRERGIRITGLLFGEESPYCPEALEKAKIFLGGGEETNEKRIIDFQQHWGLIYSAFRAQYGIDLNTAELHYQEFLVLMQGLKEQVLTDVIEILTYDMSEVKDPKQKRKILKAQEAFKIKEEKDLSGKREEFLELLSEKVKGG